MSNSVSTQQTLLEIDALKKKFKKTPKVVFVTGTFNVVHPGHLRLLNFAADCGDLLIIGVNSDQLEPATVKEGLRLESVRSIGIVDYAFLLTEPVEHLITALKPDFVVKGKEHEKSINIEAKAVQTYGGKLLFSSGDVVFSSRDLLQKEFKETDFSTIHVTNEFPSRHGFEISKIKKILSDFGKLKVTVIGDLIIDEYISCEPLGMSQEDPTIVVTPIQSDRFIGGAGIVAAHARGLGAQVKFFSLCGEDEIAEYARKKLEDYSVSTQLFKDETRPTTLKQRFRARGKTLLRVSHLKQHDIEKSLANLILPEILAEISRSDLVIFADFNYGFLSNEMVSAITQFCTEKKIKMVADCQSSSQVGDISRYENMLLITPTEREARLALQDSKSGLVVIADKLQRKSAAENVVITLGSEGILVHSRHANEKGIVTDLLPAFNHSPKDVAGAGDSFLTCSALALAVGATIWEGTFLGNIAAACQVSRTGNVPLSILDLLREME